MKDCAKDFNEVLILLELWFQLVLIHLEERNISLSEKSHRLLIIATFKIRKVAKIVYL